MRKNNKKKIEETDLLKVKGQNFKWLRKRRNILEDNLGRSLKKTN